MIPMVVTLVGIVTDVSPLHEIKATLSKVRVRISNSNNDTDDDDDL